MAEFEDLDCACAGLEGEGNPNIDQESIDVLVGVIRELHHKKKILDYKECKTIRHSGASQYKCYFELAFALLAKPHEKVKTAIKVLEKSNDPVIVQYRQIPQFLNVCLELHQLLNHEDVQEMKRRQLELIERIIHVVCMKDFAAVNELADVLGMYGFSEEKDWLLVYVKWYEERVLTFKDVQDLKEMRTPFLQRIWKLFSSKDPDALRKAGDIVRRTVHDDLTSLFPVLADIQELRYLSDEEYSPLFDHPATSLPDLMKMAIAKDRDTCKGIAAVLQKHGYDDESKKVIVLAEFVAEKCLSLEEGRYMIDIRNQLGREWIPIWSHAAADKTSQVREQMAKILEAHGYKEEAAVVRKRETVGAPMPSPQSGRETFGAPMPPPQPEHKASGVPMPPPWPGSSTPPSASSKVDGSSSITIQNLGTINMGNIMDSTITAQDHVSTAGPLSTGEEKLIPGSTFVPVHEWRKCENAVVRVRCELQNSPVHFTAFFVEDESGKVFFTTCFHSLCNEDEKDEAHRKKLSPEDFAQRLKECTCDPFYISSSDSFTEVVKFEGGIILSDGALPTLCLKNDFVMYPTKLDDINSGIRSALTQRLKVDGDILKPIIEHHYQVQAISLKNFLDIQKSRIPDTLQGIVLGHPGAHHLTYATYKMSLKPDEKIEHFMSTKDGSSGSPLFFVYNKKPVLCGIHCGYYGGKGNPNYGWQIFSQDVLPK